MYKEREFRFTLAVIISFFLHMVLFVGMISPHLHEIFDMHKKLSRSSFARGRDIIVNINQDGRRVITNDTLLSDKDSSARGHMTRKRGQRWLNNSLDFQALFGKRGKGKGRHVSVAKDKKSTILLTDESEVVAFLEKKQKLEPTETGNSGAFEKIVIPDKYHFTRENALFYSTHGDFSFNTVKYKNFTFIKRMKNKIASNWFPPLMANAIMSGYNPLTGKWAPGYTRIRAIPTQNVLVYFVLNKEGDIVELKLIDSMGNQSLDASCIDAIRLSKTFGKVPPDMLKGGHVAIPWVFMYIVD